jgi:hypothetical protein
MMTFIDDSHRQEALARLHADCATLVEMMRAKGYLKAAASWRLCAGDHGFLHAVSLSTHATEYLYEFHYGAAAYNEALAWIERLPAMPRSEDYAPWFETTPPAPAGDGGGSGDADGSGAAATSSPEIPRPDTTADGGGPACFHYGRGAAAESLPSPQGEGGAPVGARSFGDGGAVDSITRPASLADAAAVLRGLIT